MCDSRVKYLFKSSKQFRGVSCTVHWQYMKPVSTECSQHFNQWRFTDTGTTNLQHNTKPSKTGCITRDSRKSRKHGNHGNRDFHQMPWFCQNTVFAVFFGQNAVFLRFYNNILFLINISWSLLCDYNTKMFYICLCYQSQRALLPWRHRRNMYFTFFRS